MGKKTPAAPAAPDYAGAAVATAAGNKDAALATAAANRVNQYGPNGSMVYSSAGNDPSGNPTYNLTTTLSPEQQQLQNQENALNKGLLGTAQSGLTYANDVLSKPGVDQSQLTQPGQMGNAYTPNLTNLNPNTPNLANLNAGQNQNVNLGGGQNQNANLQANLPTTGYNPGQSYQDAMMARLQPQIQRENEQNDTRLANQGIMQGSEAYKNAQTALSQQHNDLLNNATVQGLQAGLQANQQAYGQNLGQAQQNLTTNQQNYAQNAGQAQQNLATNQQNYGQLQGLNSQDLMANQQLFGQNQAQNQQALSAQNQLFNQTNANYAQGLGANQQQFEQAAYNQMQPINVINALRSGTQVSGPQMSNVPQQANVAGPDLLGAAQGNYNAAMGQYNAQMASNNSMTGGLMGLGGSLGAAAIMRPSDSRLKTNIKRIGTHALGIGKYSWDYVWGEHSEGVMADEVMKVMPMAVHYHPSGYKMVDYAMLDGV